jgi:hypothetical protein
MDKWTDRQNPGLMDPASQGIVGLWVEGGNEVG